MKKLFSILSIAFIAMTVHGQDLSIGILVPGEEQGFSAAQSDLLQNRLERLCTDGGIAVVNAPDGFFLYPAVSIVSDEVAEGGMRNINVIKAEVTLSVRRIGGDVVAVVRKPLSGSGFTRSQALTSLIRSLNVAEPVFTQFLSKAKTAMEIYWQSQCRQIMVQADHCATLGDYRAAIATLCHIPTGSPCFESVGEALAKYYALFQSQLCSGIKMDVESALATHDYETAAGLLAEIDPSSDCYQYALDMFRRIEKEVAKLENRDWDFKMRQYSDAVATERHLIDACRDAAKSYYSASPNVNYTQVIW